MSACENWVDQGPGLCVNREACAVCGRSPIAHLWERHDRLESENRDLRSQLADSAVSGVSVDAYRRLRDGYCRQAEEIYRLRADLAVMTADRDRIHGAARAEASAAQMNYERANRLETENESLRTKLTDCERAAKVELFNLIERAVRAEFGITRVRKLCEYSTGQLFQLTDTGDQYVKVSAVLRTLDDG